MAAERAILGQAASAGIAIGPAYVAEYQVEDFRPQVSPEIETDELVAAIGRAVEDLRQLAGRSDSESAAILDFQIEMLLDREILALATDRIRQGDGAALAWCLGLDAYITGMEDSGDDQLAARAVDVIDLKNRVLAALSGKAVADFPEGAVYIGRDIAPSLFLTHDWSGGGGIALEAGSIFSHVALLARTRSVPMVVGLGEVGGLAAGRQVLVDGNAGLAMVDPSPAAVDTVLRAGDATSEPSGPRGAHAPVRSADPEVGLWLNISDGADLAAIDPRTIAGIGLVRTEFLMSTPADALNEEAHFDWYRRILDAAGGLPATIRMFDLGGDKTIPGLVGEGGSFLGLRGIRLLLARPEIARMQARALLRAAAGGELRALLPMVTIPDEFTQMQAIFREEAAHLARRGIAHRIPPLGIMVEVPATALTLDLYAGAAFFSCGTNDLSQYLAAAARDNPAVAHLNKATETALYRLLHQAVATARQMNVPISICGNLAGDPQQTAELLACGFRDLSVAPSQLMPVRSAIAAIGAGPPPAAEG